MTTLRPSLLFRSGRGLILLLGCFASALAAAAAPDAARRFDLPVGPAAETLRLAAQQGAIDIVFTERTVAGVRTRAVQGSLAPVEALAALLAGTELEAVRDGDSGGFAIRRAPTVPIEAREPEPPRPAGEERTVLDQFVVTGSNIPRSDHDTVQPVTVLDDRDLRDGAVGTPLELMSRLPFLGALSAYENQDGGRTRGSASSINLRGLGGQNTLILLNGRRLPYYSLPLGSLVFYNINNLPLMAVSRVEVLRDGASAVYGADATAGVVNFITHRTGTERRLAFRVGDTTDGAAAEYRGTWTHGQAFNGGRTRLLLVLDAYHRDTLMARDRDFAVIGDKRGRVAEPFGSLAAWNHLTNIGPYGSFTVNPATGEPNRLPGLTTSTAYTADSGAIVAGTRNPAAYYNDAAAFSLVPGRDSRDAFLSVEHRFGGGLETFGEVSFNDVTSTVVQSPMTLASSQNRDANDQVMVVPASNYYNPFGSRFYGPGTANPTIAPRAVQFNFLEEAIGPRLGEIETSQYRLLAGARGVARSDWQWEAAALQAGNTARDTTENSVSRSALAAALARPTPDAFNVFAGPGANAESVLAPLRTSSHLGGRSSLSLGDFKVSGPLFALPAGPLTAATGLEYREEKLRSDHSANYVANDIVNTAGQDNFRADRDVRSAFLEFQVPLLGDADRDWFRRAELQLAGRWENFSGFGSTAKPKAGLALGLSRQVFLRASVGTGFRAPTLTQLYGAESRSMAARVDAFRPQDGNVRRLIRQIASPTLRPEESESRTLGFVFEPAFVPGLSLEIDWWWYDIRDQINVVSRDAQLAAEVAGGAYSNPNVIRVAPTAAEPVGAILSIAENWRNFARARTDGYDLGLNYRLGDARRGKLTLGADASYTATYEVQSAPGGAVESFPTDDNRPRFRGTGRLEAERGRWRGQVFYRYVSHYRPSDPVVANGVSYLIPAYATWDAALTCRLPDFGPVRHVRVTAGLNNVFDRDPPLYPVRQGYDARQFSPQGRFAYLNVSLDY